LNEQRTFINAFFAINNKRLLHSVDHPARLFKSAKCYCP